MEFIPMIILAQKGSTIYPNTNLPITLWLKHDNRKIIYMQNNYNKYTTGDDLVSISIDKDDPKLLEDIELKIEEKDFKKVLDFIKKKYKKLINAVDGIDMDFSIMEYTNINRFKPTVVDGFFVEEISVKKYPSLPVNLYLYCNNRNYDDERNLYTLLMNNRLDYTGDFKNFVTVSIDKDNPQLVYDVKLGIPEEAFKRVQDFIKRHYYLLDRYIKDEEFTIDELCDGLTQWEEQQIFVGNINHYSIYVYTDDYEEYPHFHYVDEGTAGRKFNACIKIDKPEYFKHSLSRNDKLNKKQKEDLQKLLESPFRKIKFYGTTYDYIIFTWNNNYDNKVEEDKTIPNYRELK